MLLVVAFCPYTVPFRRTSARSQIRCHTELHGCYTGAMTTRPRARGSPTSWYKQSSLSHLRLEKTKELRYSRLLLDESSHYSKPFAKSLCYTEVTLPSRHGPYLMDSQSLRRWQLPQALHALRMAVGRSRSRSELLARASPHFCLSTLDSRRDSSQSLDLNIASSANASRIVDKP